MVAILVVAAPAFADPDFSDCTFTKSTPCNALPADPKGPPETGIHTDLAPADKNADEAKDVFTNVPSLGAEGDDVSPGGSSTSQGENCFGNVASGNALFVTHNGFPSGERALDNEGRTKPEKLSGKCEHGPSF